MTGPIDIGRDEAREAARRELADPIYREAEPSALAQAAEWLAERISEVFRAIGDLTPGGVTGLIVLLLVVLAIAIAVRLRAGKIARSHRLRRAGALDGDEATAAEHRAAAEAALARGDLDAAVTERFRAVVRGLEQRGVIERRPGRTADEAAADAGTALPEVADGLSRAARAFDDVYYGGRPATPEAYRLLAHVDDQVRARRPAIGARR